MEIYCTSYAGKRLTLLRLISKAESAHAVEKNPVMFSNYEYNLSLNFMNFLQFFYSFESW